MFPENQNWTTGEVPPRVAASQGLRESAFSAFLWDPKSFAGEIGAIDIFRIEDVAKFVASEALEFGVISNQFGPEDGTAALGSKDLTFYVSIMIVLS